MAADPTTRLALEVRRPTDPAQERMIRERFDARLGRVMYVDGTRVLEDVQEKLSWVRRRLDLRHPVSIQIAAVQFHSLAKAVRVVAPERGEARRFVPAPDHAGG